MPSAFTLGRSHTALALILASGFTLAGCSSNSSPGQTPELTEGQTDFTSAPPNGAQGAGRDAGGLASADGADTAGPEASTGSKDAGSTKPRTVEETDLYRLDGDRLYYLNQYRGLMVFDVTDVDQPKLLGRSPIYGSPIEMVVRGGIASVVVADWYGTMDDGTPFHGSIVRGIDARDPANMKITGEALLGGWVRDTRVVGDVLYAVTEKYPWDYGWYGFRGDGVAVSTGGPNTAQVSVSSVSFGGGVISAVDSYDVPGYGGIFNVTPASIMLASDVVTNADQYGNGIQTGTSELRYLDISDPAGAIVERGAVVVPGSVQSWGADNGRWNLDFADGKLAHVVGRTYDYSGTSSQNGLSISTVDFTDPDQPKMSGNLLQPMPGWDATARFDGARLYLTPSNWGCQYDGNGTPIGNVQTPLDVYDLSDTAAPVKIGSTKLDGQISLMVPNGDRLFALGNTYDCTNGYQSPIALAYFDMTDPTAPKALGSAEFGKGWAWTPAAGTFKAFTKNDTEGLVVLPFSGWDPGGYAYNNGLQLIEFTPESIATSGTAKTKGWVERGIFVQNRLVSLSNLALSVVDYTDHANPVVVNELTLARNVVNVKPVGDNVVEVSSDFWDNDTDHSELRVLPLAEAEENVNDATLATTPIDGMNPTVFHDGQMSYIVSSVRREVACPTGTGDPYEGKGAPSGTTTEYKCYAWTQQMQAVDTSNGGAVLRGKVALPDLTSGYYGYGWGWYGCGMYDWYYGADVVQIAGNKLAFRRWLPQYNANGEYVDALQSLYVVDASNPDAPSVASVVVTRDQDGWWGNLRSVGDQLYASHYEWQEQPSYDSANNSYYPGVVRYYIDQIDLSDAAHPRVAQKINVPGFLVGGSEDDPSLIYTMDYHWDGTATTNDLAVLKLSGGRAYLQGHVAIPGYTGSVFVKGSTAYFSAQNWDQNTTNVQLYQVDLSDPRHPSVLPSKQADGWGWLLGVEGDRAFVTSGWANQGVDIFKLEAGKAPTYDQFVRTRGWWTSSLSRQGDTVLLASGYWGTQVVNLK
jgi:hypothetical protein